MTEKITETETLGQNNRHYVTSCDCPLSCPTPEMALWDQHPRVYLPIERTGEEVCPYCSRHYILQDKT